jgi:hypothetical protein
MRSQFNGIITIVFLLFMSCGRDTRDTWVKHDDGNGGFSVLFPGKPEKTQKVLTTAFGKQTEQFVVWKPESLDISKIKLMQVSYTNCPPSLMNDSIMLSLMLDSSIKLREKDFTEKDITIQNISLNGYEGRAFIYDVGGNTVIVKQCIVNNRRYDLTVSINSVVGTNPEINRFFDSFQILR